MKSSSNIGLLVVVLIVAGCMSPHDKQLDRANNFNNIREYDSARIAYTKLIEMDPDDASSWYWRGASALNAASRVERTHHDSARTYEWVFRARDDLHKSHELDPTMWMPLYQLGYLHFRFGDPDSAISYYQQALAIDDSEPQVRMLLGRAYAAVGDTAAATQIWDEIIQDNPDHWPTLFSNAHITLQQGDTAQAIELHEQLIDAKPSDVNSRSHLAVLYLQWSYIDDSTRFLEAGRIRDQLLPMDSIKGYDISYMMNYYKGDTLAKRADSLVLVRLAPERFAR